MRSLIIHNLKSGFGSDSIFEFERNLVREGDECTMHVMSEDDTAESLVKNADHYDVVVISGGDGTATSLLYALRYRNIPTCIFPSGTANLLFANIGNANEPAGLARACRVGHTAATDIGNVTWTNEQGEKHVRGFGLMCGMGFDAQLMITALPNKRSMGEMAYFTAVLQNPNPIVSHFTIDVDGEIHECDGITCMVANNAMMQGDIEVVPDCRMDDGLLNVIVLAVNQPIEALRPLFAGIFDKTGKNIGRPQIETFKGKHIHITSSEAIPLEIDGETTEGTIMSYAAQVFPKANLMIVDEMSRYHKDSDKTPRFSGTDEIAYPE